MEAWIGVVGVIAGAKDTGVELGKSWRLTPRDEVQIQAAWDIYKEAISGFITVASGYLRSRRSLVM